MLDALTVVPEPVNEPVRSYAPGSSERASLERRLKELAAEAIDLPLTIGGTSRAGNGERLASAHGADLRGDLGAHGLRLGDGLPNLHAVRGRGGYLRPRAEP